jgi:hypothetical protein
VFLQLVNRFLSTLFAKWAAIGATHAVTIILFSRTYYDMDLSQLLEISGLRSQLAHVAQTESFDSILTGDFPPVPLLNERALCVDANGRIYEDFYYTLAEDLVVTPSFAASAIQAAGQQAAPAGPGMAEWHRIIRALKRTFSSFAAMANWGVPNFGNESRSASGQAIFATPSLASQGNFLEAINLCLNIFERHQHDRDLYRMGQVSIARTVIACATMHLFVSLQNVITLTAGSGVFEVDAPLAQVTKQRMMDNGIGCDVVSMGRPPLHVVPLFVTVLTHMPDASSFEKPDTPVLNAPAISMSYSQPHWVHCSFFGHISSGFNAIAPVGAASRHQASASTGVSQLGARNQASRSQTTGNSAAAALIVTGVALGSLPQAIAETNAMFSNWDSANTSSNNVNDALLAEIDNMVRTRGAGFAWHKASYNFRQNLLDGQHAHRALSDGKDEEQKYAPFPSASMFSMYQPRLSLVGPSYPPSLLETLRQAGRAPMVLLTDHLARLIPDCNESEGAPDDDDVYRDTKGVHGVRRRTKRAGSEAMSYALAPIDEASAANAPGPSSASIRDFYEINNDTVRSADGRMVRGHLKAIFGEGKGFEQMAVSPRRSNTELSMAARGRASSARVVSRSSSNKDLSLRGRTQRGSINHSVWGLHGFNFALARLKRDTSAGMLSESGATHASRGRSSTCESESTGVATARHPAQKFDDVVIAHRTGAEGSSCDGVSVSSREDGATHGSTQAIGVAGYDDFGMIVVEASLPSVGKHMLRNTPDNEMLYPWNKLLRRLSRRAMVVAKHQDQGPKSPPLTEPSPSVRQVDLRAAYAKFKRHDESVFSSKSPSMIVASPSIAHLAKQGNASATKGSVEKPRENTRKPAVQLPALQSNISAVYGRTHLQNFSVPVTHLLPRPATEEATAVDSGEIPRSSTKSFIRRDTTPHSNLDGPVDQEQQRLLEAAQQSATLSPLGLVGLLASSPVTRFCHNSINGLDPLVAGIVQVLPAQELQRWTSRAATSDSAAEFDGSHRSPFMHASPRLEAVAMRSFSLDRKESPAYARRPRAGSGRSAPPPTSRATLQRDMSNLQLDGESTLPTPQGSSTLASLPAPSDMASVFGSLKVTQPSPKNDSAPANVAASPTFAIGFEGEEAAPAVPAKLARPRMASGPTYPSHATSVQKIKASTSQPRISSPLRNPLPAPHDLLPEVASKDFAPLPSPALGPDLLADVKQQDPRQLSASRSAVNTEAAAIEACNRSSWSALLGLAQVPGQLAVITPAAGAGAHINPFRRRVGDLILATANRRRWWHMFPADQLAEQQFTTPSTDSADIVKLHRPYQSLSNRTKRDSSTSLLKMAGKGRKSMPKHTEADYVDSRDATSTTIPEPEGEFSSLASMLESFQPNWKSLCEPAILPLTTDFIPTAQELQAHYSETVYSVTLPRKLSLETLLVHGGVPSVAQPAEPVDNPETSEGKASSDAPVGLQQQEATQPHGATLTTLRSVHEAMVEEMVCQRLVQDYQLVIDQSTKEDGDGTDSTPAFGKRAYFLSMGHKIHKIYYDPSNASVEVKMYTRRGAAVAPTTSSAPVPSLLPWLSTSTVINSAAARADASTSASESMDGAVAKATLEGSRTRISKDAVALQLATARMVAWLARALAPAYVDERGTYRYKYLVWCPYRRQPMSMQRSFGSPAASALQATLPTSAASTLVSSAFQPGTRSMVSSTRHSSHHRGGSSHGAGFLDIAPGSLEGSTSHMSMARDASEHILSTSVSSQPGSLGSAPNSLFLKGSLHNLPSPAPTSFGVRPLSVRNAPLAPQVMPRIPTGLDQLMLEDFNWNYLDCLLTGDEHTLNDSIRYRRINLLLLPASTSTGLFAKPSSPVPGEAKLDSASAKDMLGRCLNFEKFWSQLHVRSSDPPADPKAGEKPAKRRPYEYEPVKVHMPILGVESLLLGPGQSHHLESNRQRMDSVSSTTSEGSRMAHSNRQGMPLMGYLRMLQTSPYDDSSATHAVRIDLRARGPAPFEWVHVHYGSVFNPLRAYPISLRWVIASSIAVESLVSSLQRRAKQCGFVLVSVPEYSRRSLAPSALRKSCMVTELDAKSEKVSASTLNDLPPFLSAIELPISTPFALELTHVPAPLLLPPPIVATAPAPAPVQPPPKPADPSSAVHTPAGDATELLGDHRYGHESVEQLSPLIKPRSASTASVAPPSPLLRGGIVEKVPVNGLVLLFGVHVENQQLLQQFESGIVQQFGFMPDTAAGGAGVDSGAIPRWYADRIPAPTTTAPGMFPDGNRDRTTSAASIGSSVLSFTTANLSQIGHSACLFPLLHPSDTREGWYRQYVHASATAFIRVHANGVHWIPNRLQLSRLQQTAAAALAPWTRTTSTSALPADAVADLADEPDDTTYAKIVLFRCVHAFCAELLRADSTLH